MGLELWGKVRESWGVEELEDIATDWMQATSMDKEAKLALRSVAWVTEKIKVPWSEVRKSNSPPIQAAT